MKPLLLIIVVFFLVACASQRQKAVCSEMEYRLNSFAHSPDQRAFAEEELRQCLAQQKEYAESDSLTNKAKKGIYEQFEELQENANP
ncbi:MAG TPA: hypothetical protein GX724_04115 [Fibrobacter sp.]|nr:hypothetical protein [Fibrobacter sp.]